MRSIPFLFVGAAALLLAGCSGGLPTPTPTDSSASPGDDLARCLDGDWTLDVDHLAEQLDAAVDLPGIPVAEFAVDGDGSLAFDDDGEVDGDLDVRATGELDDGTPFDVPVDADFEGRWSPGDEPGTIAIEDWTYDAEAGSGGDIELPRPMDFTDLASIDADCSGDELVLSAGSVPLEVRWLREGR